MNHRKRNRRASERGLSLLEMTFSTLILVTATFAAIDFGRMLWAHSALNDQVRKGAQYAASHSTATSTATSIKNLVVYNSTTGGTNAVVPGLTTSMVSVEYDSLALGSGTTTVKVTGYTFKMASLMGTTFTMPTYRTTLTGETAGNMPSPLTAPSL